MLVFSAADFEDFRVERPEMPPEMEPELEAVIRILAQNRWPWRLHATYNETGEPAKILAILSPAVGDEGYGVEDVSGEVPWESLR